MTPDHDKPPAINSTDTLFKRMVIVSTGLSLAAAYGWLACFDRQPNGDFDFHWRWIALLWIFIGFGSNAYFWRKVWPPAGRVAATRKNIVQGSLALLLPCLWWLTFPLRFLSGQHFWDVVEGLVAAVIVLTFGAWMVIKLIQAFEKSDANDPNAANAKSASAEPNSRK